MNYELALELKDAGFPQFGDGFALCLGNPDHTDSPEDQTMSLIPWCHYVYQINNRNRYGTDLYAPTLEELIEACGDNLEELENTLDGWRAYPRSNKATHWDKTPEGAVAKLWLALNKK